MANITFILGGARSGKSNFAETLVTQSGKQKIYLATAQAGDGEMQQRIAAHRGRRVGWQVIEEPTEIASIIRGLGAGDMVLVDCLTLWLSNLMHSGKPVQEATLTLIDALANTQASVILVSNEVGQGIVPDNALARRFRDEAGLLHQKIAASVDTVVWVVAGIPTYLKGSP